MHVSGLRIKWFNTQIGICLFCTWRLISFRFLDRRSVMELTRLKKWTLSPGGEEDRERPTDRRNEICKNEA